MCVYSMKRNIINCKLMTDHCFMKLYTRLRPSAQSVNVNVPKRMHMKYDAYTFHASNQCLKTDLNIILACDLEVSQSSKCFHFTRSII